MGLPGCGKQAVGRALARRLRRPFLDLEALLRERMGSSPAPVAEEPEAEARLRQLERELLEEMLKTPEAIIALGDETYLQAENSRLLLRGSVLVYLRRDLLALAAESGLKQPELQDLHLRRVPILNALCDYAVRSDDSEVAASVIVGHLARNRVSKEEEA